MSEDSTNPEKPVNDGGGTAPQPDADTTTEDAAVAEKPANQGGGSD